MMDHLGTRIWVLILGIGIGIALGVLLSSGFQFEKSDSARFVGSLIGSLIAVSGAVALHYLKETETRNQRRRHLKILLNSVIQFGPQAISDLTDEINASAACSVFRDRFIKTLRFAEKYEFDDYGIGESYSHLSLNTFSYFDQYFDQVAKDGIDISVSQKLKNVICHNVQMANNALNALNRADQELESVK